MPFLERRNVYRPIRAKLIFNEIAGRAGDSPHQLADIIGEMQNRDILPEVHLVTPESQVREVVRSAIRRGIHLIVVAGGDGTIHSAAEGLIDSSATLGIIPTGTRNNLAFNLGIPPDIAGAVALLRQGRRLKIDAGYLRSNQVNHFFLEAVSLGIVSDLYPAADELQHGNLAQIGTLLSTFVASTPSSLRANIDRRELLETNAFVVLIANMQFIGPHFQIDPSVCWNDGHLDMFVFSEMGKVDLISYAIQPAGSAADERIKHFSTRQVTIQSSPQMPVVADGVLLNDGEVNVLIHPRALAVMAGPPEETKGEQPETFRPVQGGR